MIKEIYCKKAKQTTLSITNNKVTAILKSDTTKTGLRLYDNGCIGVAGAIGAFDEGRLTENAKQMLKFKIPYDCDPTEELERRQDLSGSFELSDERFVEMSKLLLGELTHKFPQFAFNHKIIYGEYETLLKNDRGTDLGYKDKYVLIQLLIKHKESKNLIDSLGLSMMRMYDLDEAFKTVSEICGYYDEKVDIADEKMPVVVLTEQSALLRKFYTDLSGRQFAAGASLLSGKAGQKLFDDRFSLLVNRDSYTMYNSFFDAEGTTLPQDRFMLIEDGVLQSPYTSKKIAKQYGYPVTGSAYCEYDSVPNESPSAMSVMPCEKTMKELLDGRKAVYAVVASGGDFTSQGEFASPIQSAYLFDGERIYGRLPQLSIRSNIYDMFGKDFIGRSSDGNSENSPFKYLAMEMNVKKIGGWI